MKCVDPHWKTSHITCRVAGFLALLATAFAAHPAESLPAEYAVRWDVAEGGPQSAAETAAKRGLPRRCLGQKKDELDVSFHSLSDLARNCSRGCTVEEWHVPGGRTIVEVSQSGRSSEGNLSAFRDGIAKALMEKQRIKPLQARMAELGSTCGT